MTIPIPLQEALRDSITSGTFIDTKFWVFSKWGSKTRGVGSPRALFVNEHVTRRVPRLAFLLDEREPTGNLRTKFPTDRKPYIGDYDYEDDSDLEDDDDEDASDSEDEHAAAPPAATEEPGNNAKVVTAENSDAEDETSVISSAHVGKVVVIEDVAFVTFQALLRYLYTDEIEFASWGSAERRIARARETISESYGIPKPSPKSIYRLADRYDIPELKKLALEQIRQDLSKCNIIEEALSKYTSWYPELRELELRQLARALLSADSDRNMKLLKEQIKEYTHGKLPHAKHVISALYKLMESNESVEEPPLPTTVAHNQGDAKRDWSGLKKALTNSLTSGTFLSSQFYALESWSSTGLHKTRPIYFCGTVDSSFTSTLTACSSELGLQSAPFMHTYWPDSDLGDDELDQGGPMGCPPPSRCIREDPTPMGLPMDPAHTLNFGAAKTWSAIILWVYTGQTKFAAIGPQLVASEEDQNNQPGGETGSPQGRERRSGGSHGAITVEPCSPKSIYRLANQIGLTSLREIAFEEIRSKLNENNIVEELFSTFSADHTRVREMEHELFQSKLKPLVDGALLSNIIESSSGEHPHHAAAMELIIERSIQKRRWRMLSEVKVDPQPDSASRSKRSSGVPKVPIQQVRPSFSAPAHQSQPQPPFDFFSSSALTVKNTSPGTSNLLKLPGKTQQTKRDEHPENTKPNTSPERTVGLVCARCGGKPGRGLFGAPICTSCSSYTMKCVGCRTFWTASTKSCTSCYGEFKW